MAEQPLIVVTEPNDAGPMAWLRERARVLEVKAEAPDFYAHLAEAEGLVVRTYTKVDEALLERAPKLKVVGRGGVGLENIDVRGCRRRGVEVVYTPDANTLAVGDFVFGCMLQLLRPWAPFRERAYSAEQFRRVRNTLRGRQLDELTLGVLGMGRVGRRVGHIGALGFGMRVIYNDLVNVSGLLDFPAQSVDPRTLLLAADVLTIHVDMRPGNQNLVGPAELGMMKPSAIVINTSRGEVLDAAALALAIKEKRIAGAALDVYAPEPPADDYPLLGLENVLLTPHVAARTTVAMENMSWVVRDVLGVIEGEKPMYPAP